VAFAANTFVFNMLFYIGNLLDEERMNGTLVGLFLAPCPRAAWLIGFALGGFLDTLLAALVAACFGALVFGVRFDPNFPALGLTFLLFLISLWGLGFIFAAVGLAIKRANDLSNLLFPVTTLLGGVYYPVSLLPAWLLYPARCLPLGYGMQALADAALHHASIASLAPQLLPLAGFALVLPFLGIRTFVWLEHGVRRRGELELY
jgi:ABC-2 type transport system permease protein